MSGHDPWWASGDAPDAEPDDNAFERHRQARAGRTPAADSTESSAPQNGDEDWHDQLREDLAAAGDDTPPPRVDSPHWLGDAIDLMGRMAADATERLQSGGLAGGGLSGRDPADDHPAGTRRRPSADDGGTPPPHGPGEVCGACPVCIGLKALRAVRPEVIGHLSDAAHHLSLALRAVADAAADGPDDVERIVLDD